MSNVRLTLLSSLFFKDVPFFNDLIKEHANHVFPGKEDFVLFLEEGDAQNRTKLAKRLLSRLARESGLFVPFGLLLALLKAEEQYAPSTATTQYFPQDHFSHLVQLYLLGIYIFTHHKKLHRSMVSYFKNKRETVTHSCSLSSDETAFFDFLFVWRSFVLLHDIGYPCELPPLKDRPDRLLADIRSAQVNIRDSLCDETGIAFLSRILALDLLDSQFRRTTCEAVAPNLFQKNTSGKVVSEMLPGMAEALGDLRIDQWRKAKRIPFLHGRRFASISAFVRKPEDILAVLIHCRSGVPTLALVPDGRRGHFLVDLQNKFRLTIQELKRYAFELGTTPRLSSNQEEFEWQLFVKEDEGHNSRLLLNIGQLVNRYMTPDLVRAASEALSADAPDPLTTITSESDFLAYEHWVYETLQTWRQGNKRTPASANTLEYDVASLCANSVEGEIADHIAAFLKLRIDASIAPVMAAERGAILELGADGIVSKAMRPIISDANLIDDISRFVDSKVQTRIETELTRQRLVDDAKSISEKIYQPRPIDVSTASDALVADGGLVDVLTKRCAISNEELSAVDGLLRNSKMPGLCELITRYHPDYLERGSVDHGLASAVCSLQITSLATDLLQKCQMDTSTDDAESLRAFAGISVCLGDEIHVADLTYRVKTLMPEVTRAVAMHNLYPQYLARFKLSSFRVSLNREPFCFFAMLCDALQSWDRDRRIWQSEIQLQHKTSGDRYDIEVDGDIIFVHEHDHGIDVAKRAEALKTGLESYLGGVKDYIWLDLAQWPDKDQQPSRALRHNRVAKNLGDRNI